MEEKIINMSKKIKEQEEEIRRLKAHLEGEKAYSKEKLEIIKDLKDDLYKINLKRDELFNRHNKLLEENFKLLDLNNILSHDIELLQETLKENN
jgi:hypothetical protein